MAAASAGATLRRMNKLPTFDEFRSQALARGFDEVLERTWQPGTVVPLHTHDFAADALVVQGEMWLGEEGAERNLVAGDSFHLAAGTPHTERYGDAGATYWVARRKA
jgi:hypothetical protein